MQSDRCKSCANYFGDLVCQAFPKGIPEVILLGENPHTEPLKGQGNSIVFEDIEMDPVPELAD